MHRMPLHVLCFAFQAPGAEKAKQEMETMPQPALPMKTHQELILLLMMMMKIGDQVMMMQSLQMMMVEQVQMAKAKQQAVAKDVVDTRSAAEEGRGSCQNLRTFLQGPHIIRSVVALLGHGHALYVNLCMYMCLPSTCAM